MPNYEELTNEELENALNRWEHKKYMNEMGDHWTEDDYAFDRECRMNINAVRAEMERRTINGNK